MHGHPDVHPVVDMLRQVMRQRPRQPEGVHHLVVTRRVRVGTRRVLVRAAAPEVVRRVARVGREGRGRGADRTERWRGGGGGQADEEEKKDGEGR